MTRGEFEDWKRITERSTNKWTLDEVTQHNRGSYLFYKGGIDGNYIRVENGRASIGNYEGALPHIGEACFIELYANTFENNDVAIQRLIETGGLPFLVELFS